MPLAIEESILIAAPPERVWKLLADPFGWRFWWPQCKAAATEDRKPLRDGSRLELSLQLGFLPLTLRPTVEVAQPGKTLLWVGTGLGVTGRHAFYLEPRPNGTWIRQRETFEGWGIALFRLFRLDHATVFQVQFVGARDDVERQHAAQRE